MSNNVGYHDHTYKLLSKSHILKCFDLVNFQRVKIIYKERNNLLPGNKQRMFMDREGSNKLRRKMNLKRPEKRVYLSLWAQVVEWFA